MSDEQRTHLQIVVHDNGEVTTRDERGMPVLCKDCRFSGWLREYDFQKEAPMPTHCLHHSGGADPTTGLRIMFPHEILAASVHESWSKCYPMTFRKNGDGRCKDFVPAKKLPWWKRLFRSRRRIRE